MSASPTWSAIPLPRREFALVCAVFTMFAGEKTEACC